MGFIGGIGSGGAVSGPLTGVDGRSYRVVSGVLRNGGAAAYFQPIDDGSAHRPQNIDSVSTSSGSSGVITVDYSSIAASRVVTFFAQPDEVYAAMGISLGCSVGLDHVDISVFRSRNFADEIHWDGSAWVRSSGSSFSPFLVASFTSGVLRLTHVDIGADNPYTVSLTPAGTTYRTVVNGTVNSTEVNISFVNSGGSVVTTADTNMKVHVARPQFQPIQVDPRPLTTALSNIWIYGVLEV